jgi:phospholipid/cholesterol/gamma-HCH transport system permease protein
MEIVTTSLPTTDTRPVQPIAALRRPVAWVGAQVRQGLETMGAAARFVGDTLLATRDARTWAPHAMEQARRLGVDSMPIGFFIAVFTGIVLALLASYSFTGAVPLYFVGTLVGRQSSSSLHPSSQVSHWQAESAPTLRPSWGPCA